MRQLTLLLTLAVSACAGPPLPTEIDEDGDGYTLDVDCNDRAAQVHPDADELCNGVDDNCDGVIDSGDVVDAIEWYQDADRDGWGDAASAVTSCHAPAGYLLRTGDCDDDDFAVHPEATERCNNTDDDCDGAIDDADTNVDLSGADQFFVDDDGDGFGDPDRSAPACVQPSGRVGNGSDCDDDSETVHPGADELCNGVDDNCNGSIDEDSAVDALTWYVDADRDGFGTLDQVLIQCQRPAGFVLLDGDCDDSRAKTAPDQPETCNGVDDDCDTIEDEDDAIDAPTWFADLDKDGWGDKLSSARSCESPSDHVSDDTDCDDSDDSVYPGAPERCDTLDNDCDSAVDEDAIDKKRWFRDADADSYGDWLDSTLECTAPSGYVADDTDCDDTDKSVHPGATELCNKTDDDCDDEVDEDAVDRSTYYTDKDDDGYGLAPTTKACTEPEGYASAGLDCDDTDPTVHPKAPEYCDGVDSNCDGKEAVNTVSFEDKYGNKTLMTGSFSTSKSTVSSVSFRTEGTLTFCDGTYYSEIQVASPVDFEIEGLNGSSKTTIDVRSTGSIANKADNGKSAPQGHTLTLTGLTIDNPTDDWGGVHSRLGHLTLSDVVVARSGGKQSAGVGAVYGTTTLNDVQVQNSRSTWAAVGSPFGDLDATDLTVKNGLLAGVRLDDPTTATLTRAHVEGISRVTKAGEAMGVWIKGGEVTVDTVTCQSNAGLGFMAQDADLTLSKGVFKTNGGSGFAIIDSTADIDDVVSDKNSHRGGVITRSTVDMSDATFSNHTYILGGGGLMVWEATLDLSSSTFDNNAAREGGGLYGTAGSDVTLRTSDFDGNSAVNDGGAIYSLGTVHISDSAFTSNKAGSDGGAVYMKDGDLTHKNVDYELNEAKSNGGALCLDRTDLAEDNATYTSNKATRGGGSYIGGDVTSTGSTYDKNSAIDDGGGSYVRHGSHSFTNALFKGNSALTGGGVYVFRASDGDPSVTFTSSLVDGNTARWGGGVAMLDTGVLTCKGTKTGTYGFINNKATSSGGAVYLNTWGSAYRWGKLVMDTCDMGSGSTDNSVDDVAFNGGKSYSSYKANTTATCDLMSCR